MRREPRTRTFFRPAALTLLVLTVLCVVIALWVRAQIVGSLPQLDGHRTLDGLSAPVTVTRDTLGVPAIRGATRVDVARATGFVHAQERFFQMDLARRRAAGELAELVGVRALPLDRQTRVHRFRAVAERARDLLVTADRSLLDAYTAGVNAGLAALDAVPFEYLVLRQTPAAWRPEDSLLVVLSMFLTLQDDDASYEATLGTMRDVLPAPMVDFLAPFGTEWDAPVVGDAFAVPAVPGPDVYDLRTKRRGKPPVDLEPRVEQARLEQRGLSGGIWPQVDAAVRGAIGSNSWVVSGALTGHGGPLLANDMHLPVRVPNIWYRATLEWVEADTRRWQVSGVTLPGMPAVVVGSNGHVAWGLTNTYADWSDIVLLEVDPAQAMRYRTPDGWRSFEQHEETIRIAGEEPRHETVTWTTWGPVLPPDFRGRPRAYRWVAHDAARLARSLTPLETARSVGEAFDQTSGVGIPGQNLLVADAQGQIGWSIYGAIPRRTGSLGRFPSSWADGSRGWNGWLGAAEFPRIIDPPSHRLWTANARVAGGEMLDALGDGGYEIGSRATIIRDVLAARTRFAADDFLALQLDTSARFLERWRTLVLDTLTDSAAHGNASRAVFRAVVRDDWTGQASPDSAAYRLTRAFRDHVSREVTRFVLAECYEADPEFDFLNVRNREGAIWALVTGQPHHLLDPRFESWDDLLLAAIDTVIQETASSPDDLRIQSWSSYNITAYRHPLSAGVPLLGRWLDMPHQPLPGDLFTPRMHWGAAAASQRLIVSPGREAEGILHMPTGQSGHPLSPFYSNSHEAWVKGEATPLLPGTKVHMLELGPG
jgi:penicillin G amidase